MIPPMYSETLTWTRQHKAVPLSTGLFLHPLNPRPFPPPPAAKSASIPNSKIPKSASPIRRESERSGGSMAFSGTQQKCKACDKTVYVVDQLSADGVAYHKACFKCNHCKGTLKLSNFSSLDGVLYCKPHFEQLFKETGSYSKSFQSPAKTDDKSRPEGPELTGSPVPVEKPTPELTGSPSTVEKATPEQTGSPSTVEKATPEQTVSPRTVEKVTPELTKSPSRFQRSSPELTRSPSKAAGMFSGTQEKCVTCGKTAYPLEKVTVEEKSYHKICFKCSHGGCSLSPSNYAALEGILYCKPHFSQLFREKGSYNHLIKCASMKRTAASVSVPDL